MKLSVALKQEYISPQMAYDAVHQVLPFIKKFIKKHKGMMSPSSRQIGEEFGHTYTWGWMCTRYLLTEGYLERDPNRKYKNLIVKNKNNGTIR